MDIVPLLHKLRQKLVSIYLPQFPVPFKLSAYDLIVLTNLQEDIDVLTNIIIEFGFISSAKVNWGKSESEFLLEHGPSQVPSCPRNG